MDHVLKGLEPQKVFEYFAEISRIPRGTGNEKEISDYLVAYAKKQGLEVIQDRVLNVIIKKPASQGYEDVPAVILQGHVDMVCEKNRNSSHDFTREPIRLRLDGDMVYASDTTLGADNGIAIAYMLAILASRDIPHPATEALFTVGEEGSMTGAFNLEPGYLSGRRLINMDAEKEGCMLVSSAGGVSAKLVVDVKREAAGHGLKALRLCIGGLRGGHSGADIDKGRGNANKLMGRLLYSLAGEMKYKLAGVNGGLKANAITREAEAVVYVEEAAAYRLEEKVAEWDELLKKEYSASDGNVYVRLEAAGNVEWGVLTEETRNRLISCLMLVPFGVQTMSMHMENLVESSTNPGVVKTNENEIVITNDIRSSVKSIKEYILNRFKCLSDMLDCRLLVGSDYPGWAFNPDSSLRSLFQRAYRKKYGKELEIKAVHAGLECGILVDKLEGLDAVAIGPNVYDAHTPTEHMSVTSARETYEFLLEVLRLTKDEHICLLK